MVKYGNGDPGRQKWRAYQSKTLTFVQYAPDNLKRKGKHKVPTGEINSSFCTLSKQIAA
jgi:hypothetical protein